MADLDPLGYLTPAERAEVESLSEYLTGHSRDGFKNMPEKSIAEVMNKASPNSRFFMDANRKTITDLDERGGRYRPFEEKRDMAALVPKEVRPVLDRVATEDLTHSLNTRMGTQPVEQPTTLRDIVSASMEHHEHE